MLVGTLKSLKKNDIVRFKYGRIVNSSEISNGNEIDDIWNQSDDGTGPKKTNAKNLTKLFPMMMREG